MARTIASNTSLYLAFLFSCAVFFLFSYNSGYGYDQLEYLVIGRSIAEGIPLYTYLPSKSPAIYYLIAGLHKLGVDFDHLSLSAVITAVYAATVTLTFVIARGWFPERVALLVTGLTAASAFFTELNFLQPTALFYMCGLVAFDALLRFDRSRRFWLLTVAGVALGIGIAIKTTTAFYGLAAGNYLIWLSLREERSLFWFFRTCLFLGAGVLIVPCALLAYFWSQGTAHAFIDWTFVFPFAHYPSTTTYIAKAYTKLLWVNGYILACLPFLLNTKVRKTVMRNHPAVLAFLFGSCSYLALLKTQASHYFFPGVPFLFMLATMVYATRLRGVAISRRFLMQGGSLAAGLIIAIAASIMLYRPDAVRRLTTIRDFAKDEEPFRAFVQARVPQDRYFLVTGGSLGSTWSYWISHRYPPPPFINADVKTIWMLRNQPHEVFRALDHPLLTLVQFDPSQLSEPVMEDVFGELPQDREVMRQYLERVKRIFTPIDNHVTPAAFWRRSDSLLADVGASHALLDGNATGTIRSTP